VPPVSDLTCKRECRLPSRIAAVFEIRNLSRILSKGLIRHIFLKKYNLYPSCRRSSLCNKRSICLVREIGSCLIALSCLAISSYGSPVTVVVSVVSVFNDSSAVAICRMVKATSTSRGGRFYRAISVRILRLRIFAVEAFNSVDNSRCQESLAVETIFLK